MVTFQNMGRMGNFLFQCAAAYAYALEHNLDFTMPATTTDPKWNPVYFSHLVNKKFDESKETILIEEKGHRFQHLPFDESWRDKNIKLVGYFQSRLYFEKYYDKVIDMFGFNWKPIKDSVSVHIRRGDYLTLSHKHPPISIEWYENSMSRLKNKTFYFFSDDIDWCKINFEHHKNCVFISYGNETDDLKAMANCEHQIMSSSTYALWGYFLNLNPNKIGIIPKLWFTEGYPDDTTDIVPSEIIKL